MEIAGIVEKGKQLGRTLGFPTANIRLNGTYQLPENGVYQAAMWIQDMEWPLACMLNQGHHPTAPEGKPTIEVHILNFDGDIYGKPVRVRYVGFLRPERRFESLEGLKQQLTRDRAETLLWACESASEYHWANVAEK